MSEIYKNKRISLLKFILSLLKIIITVVLIFFALVIIVQRVTNNKQAFLGYRIYRVETGSMIPKYMVGDVILVKEKDIDKIDINDDLVYVANYGQVKGKIITHQVIRIEDDGEKRTFYTKGIANSSEDPAVSESQVEGTVVRKIYLVSIIFNLLYDTYAAYFIIIVPLTIYIAASLFHKANRRKRQQENTNKDEDDN